MNEAFRQCPYCNEHRSPEHCKDHAWRVFMEQGDILQNEFDEAAKEAGFLRGNKARIELRMTIFYLWLRRCFRRFLRRARVFD